MFGIQTVVFSKDVRLDLETLADLRCRLIKAACFLGRTNVADSQIFCCFFFF